MSEATSTVGALDAYKQRHRASALFVGGEKKVHSGHTVQTNILNQVQHQPHKNRGN